MSNFQEKQKAIEKEMIEISNTLSNFTKSNEYSKGYSKGYSECQKEYEEKLRWIPVSEFDFEKYGSEFVLLKNSEKAIPVIRQVLTQDDLHDYVFFRLIEI